VLYDGYFRGLGQLPCGVSEAILYAVTTIGIWMNKEMERMGISKDTIQWRTKNGK